MNLSGNHADPDKEVDLTDIRIFKQQYEANFRRLKYFGMQYIPDEEVVADLIQDVWLRIWERQEVFPNLVAFRAYLSQSLYHAILNHLKHARVETEYAGQAVSREPQEEEVTIRMIKAEVYQMVNAAFDDLPTACRQPVRQDAAGDCRRVSHHHQHRKEAHQQCQPPVATQAQGRLAGGLPPAGASGMTDAFGNVPPAAYFCIPKKNL